MTTYAADTDGATVCVDCIHGACVASGMPCENGECQCECNADMCPMCGPMPCRHGDEGPPGPPGSGKTWRVSHGYSNAERARELDDRPDEKLASIARDIEYEARPDQLERERYPDHRELLAERIAAIRQLRHDAP